MPHRCMNCGKMYDDGSDELIDGCECGSSLFMYEQEAGAREMSEEEREEVTEEIQEMAREGVEERENIKFEFDLDSISIQEEGVYQINVSRLLKEIPLVIRREEGNYYIQLPSAFNPEDAKLETEELE
ncbi:MAG: Zn-ribbon domain-containing protein [Candidatus Nanohaloarchaea archaeon]